LRKLADSAIFTDITRVFVKKLMALSKNKAGY